MFTVNIVQQLLFGITCTQQTVSQHLVCLTGNGAYCYIHVSFTARTSVAAHPVPSHQCSTFIYSSATAGTLKPTRCHM